jgi:hypothetical protein
MTAMTEERQESPAAPAVKRPGIGIVVDPARVRWYREHKRAMSREDLSLRITKMNLLDERGDPLTLTRDAIAKIENPHPVRGRNPKPRSVQALCAGLGCEPEDLMPDGPPLRAGAAGRHRSTGYLRGMREFAIEHGIRHTKPSGGMSYNRPLRDAYELFAGGAPDEDVAVAIAAARAKFPAAPASPPAAEQSSGLVGSLDLPQGTHNTLIAAGILTRGDLAERTDADLRGLGLSARAVAGIRAAQGAGQQHRLAS